jgi:C1A family cysteine protease
MKVDLPIKRPRRYGWKRDLPDYRDRCMAVRAPVGLPEKAELPRPLLASIRDQGDLGACTGFATRTALRFVKAKEGEPFTGLSPMFIYYNGRVIEDTVEEDAGCEIRDVIKGVVRLGAAPEADYPYDTSKFTQKPPEQAYTNARQDIVDSYARVPQTIASLKHCIVQGFPIIFGFSVYANIDDEQVREHGLLGMPRGRMDGGHAVCAVAYDDDKVIENHPGAFLFANSWGKEWGCEHAGSKGYCWIPYNYIGNDDLAADFWTIKGVT